MPSFFVFMSHKLHRKIVILVTFMEVCGDIFTVYLYRCFCIALIYKLFIFGAICHVFMVLVRVFVCFVRSEKIYHLDRAER